MPKIKAEIKYRIIQLHKTGHGRIRICKYIFKQFNSKISPSTVRNIIAKYNRTGEILKTLPRSQKKRKFGDKEEHLIFVENEMRETRDISSGALSRKIKEKFKISYSAASVRKFRKRIGWTCSAPKYCQMIRDVNKEKRVEWCRDMLASNETFDVRT